MKKLTFIVLIGILGSAAHATPALRESACLPAHQRIATDGKATAVAGTSTRLQDQYANVDSSPEAKCIHFVEAKGEGANRPLLVLLHGVPETWYAWRKTIDPLVEAGFDLIIPDLPGLGQSSRPSSVDGLALPTLARDIRQLIELSGRTKAVVAGHDIGGTVAWAVAMYEPASVEKLVILSAPHPGTWRKALVDERVEEQYRKSRYAYDFAFHGDFFAWVTDHLPKKLNLSLQAFRSPIDPRKYTTGVSDADIRVYGAELGRAQQALWITRYYTQIFVKTLKIRESDIGYQSELWPLKPLRIAFELKTGMRPVDAELKSFTQAPVFPKVQAPTLLIFDKNDPYNSDVYLSETELYETTASHEIVQVENSTHWLLEDVPGLVVDSIKDFLGR